MLQDYRVVAEFCCCPNQLVAGSVFGLWTIDSLCMLVLVLSDGPMIDFQFPWPFNYPPFCRLPLCLATSTTFQLSNSFLAVSSSLAVLFLDLPSNSSCSAPLCLLVCCSPIYPLSMLKVDLERLRQAVSDVHLSIHFSDVELLVGDKL